METCLWCTEFAKSRGSVTQFLSDYCTGVLTPKEIEDANSDFIYCSDCVVVYHQARERVPALHKRLWELETARLQKFFRHMLEMDVEEFDVYLVDNGHEQPVSKFTCEEFNNQLMYPLMEVLKYPYLLCHRDLCEMVVKVLRKLKDMNNSFTVQEQYPGTYLLMVHPEEHVRHWALDTARSSGRVDRDKYYDLQEVFSCLFYIIDLGITVDLPDVEDNFCSGKLQMLPPHLYDSQNKKSYWLGICMLLMQLDSQAMDNLLMGPEGQASITQCIINTMSDCNQDDLETDPFWPALHCFLVILDRLGSKVWGQIEPLEAFRAITKAGSYMAEIENIRQKTSSSGQDRTRVKEEPGSHDDLLSCSQIVYDCYTSTRSSRSSDCSSSHNDPIGKVIFDEIGSLVHILQSEMGQGMRIYGSTFLWLIPFVRSIMELSVINSVYMGEVIHYLDNNVNKDVLHRRTEVCDSVTEFFIRILVDIIELHLNRGYMATMSYFSHIWVDMVILCSTLTDVNCNTKIHDWRGGRGIQMPSAGVGAMSQACMKLIRSLLKEGVQIGTVPESENFFGLINKHMRFGPTRAWHLSKAEHENLKKCLLKLVKAIADRPAVLNYVPPCAPPTPPSEPLEKISFPTSALTPPLQELQTKDAKVGPSGLVCKEEPLWEYEGSFCDDNEEIIRVKNEPYNSIPISEFRPPLDVSCIKPDLGKVQEIRSVLNDDRKYSRIKAVVKRESEKEVPSTSQSVIPDSALTVKSSKRKLDDEDEPLDVRRRRLKNTFKPREKDSSCARQVSVQSISANESSIIIISDDEISSNDKQPESRATCDPSLDYEINSPGRDYDDLSESQVFEFETQEDMVSAWNEPHLDIPVVTRIHDVGNSSKACISHDVEPMETQPISDEDIEKAVAQICQKQEEQCMRVPSKPSYNGKSDFSESKYFKNPPGRSGLSDKGKQRQNRKLSLIEALSQKIKIPRRSHDTIPQDTVKPCSSTMPTSSSVSPSTVAPLRGSSASSVPPSTVAPLRGSSASSVSPSTVAPLRGSSASSVSPSTVAPLRGSSASSVSPSTIAPLRGSSASSVAVSASTPAIVPPKKIRKPVEPKSAAERLGLKKKERKAFDLSQRSLVSLGELRSHGQNVHVEPQHKSKRVQQQKFVKKGKKLLASQDLQFFQQSRGMLQKPEQQNARTPAAALVSKSNKCPVPDTLSKTKPANETVQEPSDEEDDYAFLPCSQPDPDQRIDGKIGTSEVNASLSNDSKTNPSKQAKKKKSTVMKGNEFFKDGGDSTVQRSESGAENGFDDDEWTLLTQNEPTDMELCSQIDEAFGENFTAGYVGMDNNSGNQPNGSVGETSLPFISSAGTLQDCLSAGTTETSSNEHVFLKPSMPPECQKKAKLSTTKIYTSSSRSASLAREMEKVANPQPAANNVKAKVARPQPPAMQPPPTKGTPHHEVLQPPPPRPILHHPNQVSKSSLSTLPSASHVPSYKTYSRPEAPVSAPTRTVARDNRLDNIPTDPSHLKQAILKLFKYSMFENYKKFGTPKDWPPFSRSKVPMTFSSYQKYFNIMYPLLFINTYEEMASEWVNVNSKKIRMNLYIQGFEYINRTASASFTASLDANQERMQLYPKEDDLVLLWLPKNTCAYVNDEPSSSEQSVHFGCVSQSSVFNDRGHHSTLNLTIQTLGNVSSVNTQPVYCQVVGSLVTALREFKALCLLQNSTMLYPVLSTDIKFFEPHQEGQSNQEMPEYNESQADAIRCGVAMVKRKEKTPKILLIHGPPGTGKSKIIVGILDKLLPDSGSPAVDRYAKPRRTRILLCAPSNAAIDSLMKKIIQFFKAKWSNSQAPQGTCGDINLVRLGNEKICEELKGFSLDSLVNKRLEKVQQKSDLNTQMRMKELDKIIEKLSQDCAKTNKKSPEFKQLYSHKQSLLKEREQLSKKMKELRSKRQEVQSRFLLEAHVICCTLSASGSSLLESSFRRLGHEPFNCVIIDEAGQAKEIETLIPLQFRCHNLILVGDHQQLPPTVKSQEAKELGYDQSLMGRFCKSLDRSIARPSSRIFLNIQYRMHPDICKFPSKHIYNNNLKTDSEMENLRSTSWPFESYRVFDVTDGKERKEGDSFANPKEVKLVVLLLKQLGRSYHMRKEKLRIGIITPYSAQKRCIKLALEEELDKELKICMQIEVDTVDGFQGREMECIVVSLVRACNKNGSIGFVGNRQRMNVTITRAKFSLFILGHLHTLKMQEDWGSLIEDAKERGTIIKVTESNFYSVTQKVLKLLEHSSYSHIPPIPACSERERDHRLQRRPSDPRLPQASLASREQNRGNQSLTRSFSSPSERHQERHSFPSYRTHRTFNT